PVRAPGPHGAVVRDRGELLDSGGRLRRALPRSRQPRPEPDDPHLPADGARRAALLVRDLRVRLPRRRDGLARGPAAARPVSHLRGHVLLRAPLSVEGPVSEGGRRVWVDTDVALGAPRGDVDDGFALA